MERTQLWHLTSDAPRQPVRPIPGERVLIRVGSHPIREGQSVRVRVSTTAREGEQHESTVTASWTHNRGPNSYWCAELGPFARGDVVSYSLEVEADGHAVVGTGGYFRVGPRLLLALLWHQHQPLYKDTSQPLRGAYRMPWVRLHALRDYYSMPAMVAAHPGVHVTFNLTPCLLLQLTDYAERGATDEALDLTLTPAERLTAAQRDRILDSFFEANIDHQILRHPRYRRLLEQRNRREPFASSDIRDLQMWFNLAWFGEEFRQGSVELPTGEIASVRRFVEQGSAFSVADVEEMVAEQMKILRAVIPIHKKLQDAGQIEVSTSPFYHPILPLLIDTDRATLDRPGASLPRRFGYPQDADAQMALAVEMYRSVFGRAPCGMWPSEGAVADFAVPLFVRHGISWIASDQGVLARSKPGRYKVDDPDVLCTPYRLSDAAGETRIFFRATRPSDRIGFELGREEDYRRAAATFLDEIRKTYARPEGAGGDRILTVALDGENAWGGYREDARPFLHALYQALENDREIETVTFTEYLKGNPARQVSAHPTGEQPHVQEIFTGSWIDEKGSTPGVDLGTWIGEPEENRAWELLREARERLDTAGATPATAPAAFDALYAAEGSDWFWWYGDDQDSGNDEAYDQLFRMHLRNVYHFLGVEPPATLGAPIVRGALV